jgi:hypothetical protein
MRGSMDVNDAPCFLLLMRHRASGPNGQSGMREVAKRLAETLSGLNRPGLEPYRIKLGWLLHAESDVASETAMTVLGELASNGNPHVQTRADPDFNDVFPARASRANVT